jgi:sterol desaturase/sphingolipid hydroxylase (fatty acid hydroxylase superfamily)
MAYYRLNKRRLSYLRKNLKNPARLVEFIPAKLQEKLAKDRELRRQVRDRTVTVVTAAVGLAAALLWQTAIIDAVKHFVPVEGAWYYEIAVALLFTVLAAVVILWLNRYQGKQS